MKILLSIKPEFAYKIFDGTKRYEFRRVIFKRDDVKKVIVYVSAPVSRIIGEFEIDSVLVDEPTTLWKLTKKYSGINEQTFFDYFSNTKRGYAIKVKNCTLYDSPLILDETFALSPPQSFAYID
jgi:predicted transcriptional regulator